MKLHTLVLLTGLLTLHVGLVHSCGKNNFQDCIVVKSTPEETLEYRWMPDVGDEDAYVRRRHFYPSIDEIVIEQKKPAYDDVALFDIEYTTETIAVVPDGDEARISVLRKWKKKWFQIKWYAYNHTMGIEYGRKIDGTMVWRYIKIEEVESSLGGDK